MFFYAYTVAFWVTFQEKIVENELDVSLSQHDVSMTGQEGDGLAEVDEKDSNFTPVCEAVSA